MAKRDPYSKETVKARRKFPTGKTIALIMLVVIQALSITLALVYTPKPQDRILNYEITAEPLTDGSIDIDYKLVWKALDTSEELTWVDIGMANDSFDFYEGSFSSNIDEYEKYTDGDYVSARLYLDRPYEGGETLTLSFSVNQRDMLCKNENGYFYEFVPGWFNAAPIDGYTFIWNSAQTPTSTNGTILEDGRLKWEGSMDCGDYVKMSVQYGADSFHGVNTVKYREFDDSGAYNELDDDKTGAVILAVFICLIILIAEVYMIDGVVSYHRGRGFLTGYGYHIHTYGYVNPRYRREQQRQEALTGHGGRGHSHGGGGCACACACACAGGGRAGCSQKDTAAFRIKTKSRINE